MRSQLYTLRRFMVFYHLHMLTDLLITIFADQDRMNFNILIAAYVIQILSLMFVSAYFVFQFTSSFPFKAGMLVIMFKEFRAQIVVTLIYFVVLTAYKGSLMVKFMSL